MAPITASPTVAGPTLHKAPLPDVLASKSKYNDWRADLQQNGYAVVKGAIPHDRAVQYQSRAFEWLKSFDTELDLSKPETWIKENLPLQSDISTFRYYGVVHEKFMWDVRTEPGVLDAFTLLWNTDELLASFDALNITFPNRKDIAKKVPWEHIDQSPLRRGVHCVQGIANLSVSGPEDGGLLVYPGSHKYHDEFFDTQTDSASWDVMDWYPFKKEELEFFTARGCKPTKVCAEPGDLILWDSRTIHYGAEPSEKSDVIRTVCYVAFTPATLASKDFLGKKKDLFERWSSTTHWPHDNFDFKENKAYLEDGTRDPRDREEPREKPVLTPQLLKLAGAMDY